MKQNTQLMNENNNRTSARWTFCMIDNNPGPSQGDAAELIETLGLNPWAFARIELVNEVQRGRMFAATFAVVGPKFLVNQLRANHDLVMKSGRLIITPPLAGATDLGLSHSRETMPTT